jgi:peptidoglycan/LPS O-acetylase OafA/YrhL
MGIYRYLLACCVVVEHLSGNSPSLTHTGMFAVVGFYVLSGYLITRVLNDVYGFRFAPFWSNRILRLYPPYFVFLAVGLVLVLATDSAADFFPAVWKARPSFDDWFGVITVFPMGVSPMDWHFRPVPSIWSVGVELLNYALLYVVVARGKHAALWVAIGAASYHVFGLWRGDSLDDRYFPFYAALLPFALGALIYFYSRSSSKISPRKALLLCSPVAIVCVLAGVFGGIQDTWLFEVMFYLNMLFQCLAVLALARMTQLPYRRLDKAVGDLSYPVFLGHWLVGYVIAALFFPDLSLGLGLMAATLVGSTAVAYVACRLQDVLIEPVRSTIRTRAATMNAIVNVTSKPRWWPWASPQVAK